MEYSSGKKSEEKGTPSAHKGRLLQRLLEEDPSDTLRDPAQSGVLHDAAEKKVFYVPDSYRRKPPLQAASRFKKSGDYVSVSLKEDVSASVEQDMTNLAVHDSIVDDRNAREEEERDKETFERLSRVFGFENSANLIRSDHNKHSFSDENYFDVIDPPLLCDDDPPHTEHRKLLSKSGHFTSFSQARKTLPSAHSTADSGLPPDPKFKANTFSALNRFKEPQPYFCNEFPVKPRKPLPEMVIKEESKDASKSFERPQPPLSKSSVKTKKARQSYKMPEEDFIIDFDQIHETGKKALNIKNIPNKYTKKMLMDLIDKDFAGCYSFFYLPIDFNQKCNVGYAFIMFDDLKHIKPFCQRFNNRKWPHFNSEKICEIRYARLQKLEDLMNHFRNSSLMRRNDPQFKPFIKGRDSEKSRGAF